jgi:hypothetical protein
LSSSPDGEYVVVAGREGITHLTEILIAWQPNINPPYDIDIVLKVLHVTTQEVTEYINLRTGSNLSLNYSSNDVKWGNNGKLSRPWYWSCYRYWLYSIHTSNEKQDRNSSDKRSNHYMGSE